MSYIPDCRTDSCYNEKYLSKFDMTYVEGYDWAVSQMLNLFEGNEDVYPDLIDLVGEDGEVVKRALEHWMEMQRDELITSMIDAMDDETYHAIKREVDGENV